MEGDDGSLEGLLLVFLILLVFLGNNIFLFEFSVLLVVYDKISGSGSVSGCLLLFLIIFCMWFGGVIMLWVVKYVEGYWKVFFGVIFVLVCIVFVDILVCLFVVVCFWLWLV